MTMTKKTPDLFDNWQGVKTLKKADKLTEKQKQAGSVEGLTAIWDKENRLWRFKKIKE